MKIIRDKFGVVKLVNGEFFKGLLKRNIELKNGQISNISHIKNGSKIIKKKFKKTLYELLVKYKQIDQR